MTQTAAQQGGRRAGRLAAALLVVGLMATPAQAQREPLPVPEPARSLEPVRPPEMTRQLHRAETAWKSGKSVLEAKARLDRVLAALPNDAEARKLRAQVLLSMNRPEAALADIQGAIGLGERDGEAYLVLCEAARLSGKPDVAKEALDAAAELVEGDAALHVRLSWNAVALDRLDQAEAFARVARVLDPGDPMAYYQLARVFVLKEQPDDAAAVLASGLEAAVVDPLVVAQDATLRRLAGHDALRPYVAR